MANDTFHTCVSDLTSHERTTLEANEDLTRFRVRIVSTGETVTEIKMQDGPVREAGINGIFVEDLIAASLAKLESFQSTDFRCRENACAITKLEEALMWLRKRTDHRRNAGVLGTSSK